MENSFTVLLAVMVVLTCLVFVISEYDILNPVCIVVGMMTLSVFLATTTVERWHLYMSAGASLLIITSMLSFAIGGFWADYQIKKNVGSKPAVKDRCIYEIKTSSIILLSIFILILGYFQYKEFYAAAQFLGNQSGPLDFSSMIKTIRPSIEQETFKFSRWTTYRLMVAQSCLFCSLLCFFLNSIKEKSVNFFGNIKYLIPLLAFIPFVLANTGRTVPLEVMLFSLLTGGIVYQIQRSFSYQSRIRTIGFFLLCGIGFFSVFLLLGTLSGKVVVGGRSPYETLAHYVGLSMPAFSVFVDRVTVESQYIGNHTLFDVYNKLRMMGIDVPTVRLFLPFVGFNDISTNVYTMMARYISDYGILGMHIIMAIIAMVYVSFYDYIRIVSHKCIAIAFYGWMPMTLFFATNDERFMQTFFSTSALYQLLSLYIMFKILVREHPIKDNEIQNL